MRAVCILALGAAAFVSSSANAQVLSRSVSREPVETIVTQTPNGVVVTRRPVGTTGVSYGAPPVVVETRPLVSRGVALTTQTNVVRKSGKLVQSRAPRIVTRTVALTPVERRIVYQTIVEREVAPRTDVIAPAPVYGTPLVITEPAYAPPVLAQDETAEAVEPTYAYAVGSALPRNVPLYAVPEDVGYRVPAARPYSYAYLDGRVYLVDPATSVIVADVTE